MPNLNCVLKLNYLFWEKISETDTKSFNFFWGHLVTRFLGLQRFWNANKRQRWQKFIVCVLFHIMCNIYHRHPICCPSHRKDSTHLISFFPNEICSNVCWKYIFQQKPVNILHSFKLFMFFFKLILPQTIQSTVIINLQRDQIWQIKSIK